MKLSDICDVYSGYAFKTFNDLGHGVPVIKISNLLPDGSINLINCLFTTENIKEKYYSKKSDIYIALSGATTGKISIMDKDNTFAINQRVGIVRNRSTIPNEYLKYFLMSKSNRILEEASGCAQPNISPKQIANYDVPIYSDAVINKIVSELREIDKIKNTYQKQLELLDELVKARFVEMFGTIYDKKFDMKTLPDIVSSDKNSIKRGPFGGALKKEDFLEDGYMVYEQRHAIHEDFKYAKYYVSPEKYESMIGFKVVPGDLIISCSGTLGRIAEVPMGAKEGIINQALLKISLNKDIMNNQFFIYQFRCKEIQDMLFGISRGSGIANMPSMNEVKAFKFICPPLELQNQFASFVKEIDKSRSRIQKSLEASQELFDSLMQKYFG